VGQSLRSLILSRLRRIAVAVYSQCMTMTTGRFDEDKVT
jgi:hypothetical protein